MRRLITLIAAAVFALVMGAAPAIAHPVIEGDPCASPGDFAHGHVVPTAQHGLTDPAHGPGVGNSGHSIGGHQGYGGFCSPGNA
ncbi:MAG TPA: hypothetical protein VK960_05780 [Acidimicrobiia bacterium]|nr:hypothetical protein [Acidimicrobiia bacterium]